MKTNAKLPPRFNLKRKFDPHGKEKPLSDYTDDDMFDPGEIKPVRAEIIDGRKQMPVGVPRVQIMYDSSRPPSYRTRHDDELLYLSNLAICFYNIMEGTYYCDVKVLRVTRRGYVDRHRYITFQACSSKIKTKRVVPVTFQTKILVCNPEPRPKFEIMFVRIKPHHKRRQTSESDHDADIYQQRLSQLIETYDFSLDSQYSLAYYLSQLSLLNYYRYVLAVTVAKHDMESLKVLKLVKLVAKVPTYQITFEAPLLADTEGKGVETFETELCMPTLFPTTVIELKSDARVVPGCIPPMISVLSGEAVSGSQNPN